MKSTASEPGLTWFLENLTNHPWLVIKVLKFHRVWIQKPAVNELIQLKRKLIKMFDGIFRAQLTEDKIGTVSLLVGKAPWNFIFSKGRRNSWVLMVVLWGYLGCYLISAVFIELRYFSLMTYTERWYVDLKLPRLIIRNFLTVSCSRFEFFSLLVGE